MRHPFHLEDDHVRLLGERGYFVVDGFLGPEEARQVRREAIAFADSGALHAAGISRGEGFRVDEAERGDEIGWLDPTTATPALAGLHSRYMELQEALNEAAWLGLRRSEVQVARYAGNGARYVRHLDAFPGGPNRTLTAIYYLNEGWKPEHGGGLRLYTEPPVDVEPILDRLVVFLSGRLEHEVLPTWVERLAITGWFYGREQLPR